MNVFGFNGIVAMSTKNPQTDEVSEVNLTLGADVQDSVNFTHDARRSLGMPSGYEFAARIHELTDFMDKVKDDWAQEARLRLSNPAVAEAYSHYKTMVALAKEHHNE